MLTIVAIRFHYYAYYFHYYYYFLRHITIYAIYYYYWLIRYTCRTASSWLSSVMSSRSHAVINITMPVARYHTQWRRYIVIVFRHYCFHGILPYFHFRFINIIVYRHYGYHAIIAIIVIFTIYFSSAYIVIIIRA